MSEQKILTDRTLKALKPAPHGERYDLRDALLTGFGVRVNDERRVTFFVLRRRAGDRRLVRYTIGTYPTVKLERARELARQAIEDLTRGVNPKDKRDAQGREEARRRQQTFASVAEEFIARHASKLRSKKQIEAVVRGKLIVEWGKRPVSEITRRDVISLIDRIADEIGRYSAHHVLAIGRKLFNWAVARDVYGLESSPFDRMSGKEVIGAKEHRQRVLNDDEIRLVWRAAEDLDQPFGPFVRALLLTGQRRQEVAGMRWPELKLETKLWTIPAERMKNNITHEVPLAPAMVELIDSLPRFQGGAFVFTTTAGKKPISGFSKVKRRLERLVAKLRDEERGADDDEIPRWTLHDLRRTMRTRLSALPIADNVRELMIGHAQPGLHKVYDLHQYLEEKRCGFELWAARLKAIVEPVPENVVNLSKRKKA